MCSRACMSGCSTIKANILLNVVLLTTPHRHHKNTSCKMVSHACLKTSSVNLPETLSMPTLVLLKKKKMGQGLPTASAILRRKSSLRRAQRNAFRCWQFFYSRLRSKWHFLTGRFRRQRALECPTSADKYRLNLHYSFLFEINFLSLWSRKTNYSPDASAPYTMLPPLQSTLPPRVSIAI